jgi:hypothetical protein
MNASKRREKKMVVCYSPMYPKLLHRFIGVMGPKGLANLAEDSKIDIKKLKAFAKTGNLEPLAENIPELWSLIFERRTPLEANAMLEENNM